MPLMDLVSSFVEKNVQTYLFFFPPIGADNFYDAGSCIDGRLTSGFLFIKVGVKGFYLLHFLICLAWNWCSQLPDKQFYILFKLTGFSSFDGEFSD